jgi:hypothetical protein
MSDQTISRIAEGIAFISIIFHFYQYYERKTVEKVMVGFFHALKPVVESASNGDEIPKSLWAGMVTQINDMLSRLQPPKK